MTESSPNCARCGTSLSAGTTAGLCPKCLLAMNLDSRTMPEDEKPPAVPAPTTEELADKLPQFEIMEYLGRGGMGIVYKARQKALDRIVAIKILAGECQNDPGFSERFEKEAKLLARLNHPNIVTVHDFGESDGLYYIVMEFVDGVNLRDLLRDGHLEPKQALGIIPPVCEALQFAHDKGIVHRDIKPENLLLDREGRIKIADFGIAAMVGATGETSGTPPYMAPEQGGANTDVDHRVDIYALGAVLYEALTGERPDGPLHAPSQKVQIDIRIDDIVLRALNKEPERRYGTADQFRTMVETVAATPSTPPSSPDPSPPLTTPTASATTTLDPRWTRGASIALIVVGAINLLTIALSLIVLPIGIAILKYFSNTPVFLPETYPSAAPQVTQLDLFSSFQSVSPVDAFNSGFVPLVLLIIAFVFSLTVSILTLLGGRHMLRGTSRHMAIAGAVSCCFTPFSWPLGFVIGVFALVVLLTNNSPHPATVGAHAPGSPQPAVATESGPRLSVLALTGAILQFLALGLILLLITLGNSVEVGPGVAWSVLTVILGLFLLLVPGAICGMIAASQIRNSEGQLRGMGFAKFAVIFPLVIFGLSLVTLSIRLTTSLLFLENAFADKTTLLIVGILAAITSLTIFFAVLGKCSRGLSGTPKPPRSKTKWLFCGTLLTLWIGAGILVWIQRPYAVHPALSSKSPDQQYSVLAFTDLRMRVFGGDVLSYRFKIQGKGGSLNRDWEIRVPVDRLATDYLAAPNTDYYFADKGRIQWAPDSKSVKFFFKDILVFSLAEEQNGNMRETVIPQLHQATPSLEVEEE
jgi:serine/threonine protein kinase